MTSGEKRCIRCGEIKPLGEFKGRQAQCRVCFNASQREWYAANRQRRLGAIRARRQASPGKAREAARQWRVKNPDAARESSRKTARKVRDGLRAQVFARYGSSCACCGTTERLTIGRVSGDGRQRREELFGRGQAVAVYRWLVKNGLPDGFETLCRPCNRSRGGGTSCGLWGHGQDLAARRRLGPRPDDDHRTQKEINNIMTEWTEREGELEARAAKAGLTLIHPPAGTWVIISEPSAVPDVCAGLDEVEAVIAANEPAAG